MSEMLPLRGRIAAITGEIKIAATGKTERGQRTISIGDVDAALGPLMAKHGVVSHYRFLSEPTVAYELPTRNEGTLRMWKVHIEGVIEAVDYLTAIPAVMVSSGQEVHQIEGGAAAWADSAVIRAELWDIGSSPSGAVSFALKRWLRALFKLAEDDDALDKADQERARTSAPPLTLSQQIAIACRDAGLKDKASRDRLRLAVVGKSDELSDEEGRRVLNAARGIARGESRLEEVDGEWAVILADSAHPSQVSLPVDGETT